MPTDHARYRRLLMPEPHTYPQPPCRHVRHPVPAHAQLTQLTAVGAVCRAQCEPMDMVLIYATESVSSVSYLHEPTIQDVWIARVVQDGHRGRAGARSIALVSPPAAACGGTIGDRRADGPRSPETGQVPTQVTPSAGPAPSAHVCPLSRPNPP